MEDIRVESLSDVNTELLERVLNASRPNTAPKLAVTSFSYSNAVPRGENFTSSLYRYQVEVQVEGETPSKLSLVIKLTPETPQGRQMIEEMGCFPREVSMYNKYVPYLEGELGASIAPKLYLGKAWGPHGVLIMEDLKETGFLMLKGITCEDVALCGRVVRLLARMHAAGHKLIKAGRVGPLYDEYPFPKNLRDVLSEMMEAGMTEAVRGVLAHSPDLQQYAGPIAGLCRFRCEDLFYPVFTSDNPAFRTVIHGDCWNNNMMASEADIKLVDWQLSRPSLGPKELQYFLYSSTDSAFRLEHLETMYRLYHDTYLASLAGSESRDPDYTYDRFREECARETWYPFSVAIVFAKRIAAPQAAAEFDINKSSEEMEETMRRIDLENVGKVVAIFRDIICEFVAMGLLASEAGTEPPIC